jgi:integrase
MRGRIFTEQKCSICGGALRQDERRRGLYCQDHADQRATGKYIVQFGRKIRKRFKDYRSAERFLDGLRYEVDKGTYDYRDYLSSNPLSFTVLSNQYLIKKKADLKESTHKRLSGQIKVAQAFFENTNVKSIQYANLEDFTDSLTCGKKSISNYLSNLHGFFKWLLRRKEISRNQFPEFPTISYELGFRKTVDKDTQQAIIEKVREISYHVSPKIWLGIKWLSTYISIRPNELRNIKEGDIDIKQGFIFIPHPKEKRPKFVPLLQEDIEIIKKLPKAFPELYFFRHAAGVSGVRPGQHFGQKLLYKWWKRACSELGIEGIDLYGGTRHSSAIDLRNYATPEEIKRATMHTTNKAFERYFQVSKEELQEMYAHTRCDTTVIPFKREQER